jgi:hypothetical protein
MIVQPLMGVCNPVVASVPTAGRDLNQFFNAHSQTMPVPSTAISSFDSGVQPHQALIHLSTPLKLTDSSKLTRSQCLFAVATRTDPRSMAIKEDYEFFLFMDMRAEFQWASFNMTSRKWVMATQAYNTRLEAINSSKNRATIKKNPRALMDFLGAIEPKISERIIKQDFFCEAPIFFVPKLLK